MVIMYELILFRIMIPLQGVRPGKGSLALSGQKEGQSL